MSNYIAKRVKIEDITLEGEIWKDIPQLKGLYLVSSLGRIYSKISNHVLTTSPHIRYGYVCVPIGKRGERNTYRVHRLVAKAFLPNPHNKSEVNHKNKNKSDNRVENLEWMSGLENTQHKYGRAYWHGDQGRITPSHHSVSRRKVEGFSKVIIPMLHKIVPLNSPNYFAKAS